VGLFTKATKKKAKARIALIGPSGSGKTYSALAIGQHLGQRMAVIDTEHGTASKYSDTFTFDVLELELHDPRRYVEAIKAAEQEGYDVLVIDSLSHAWAGRDGLLEFVDKTAKRSQHGNSFAAWREATPLHNQLVDALTGCRMHLIVTMRAKTEYVVETDNRGKQVPRKIGLAPIQRDGVEYEFDVTADLTADHDMIVGKTRCPMLDGQVYHKPGQAVADVLLAWLTDGDEPVRTGHSNVSSGTRESNELATAEEIDELRRLAQGHYGDGWEQKLEELVLWRTKNFTRSALELQGDECADLIQRLTQKVNSATTTASTTVGPISDRQRGSASARARREGWKTVEVNRLLNSYGVAILSDLSSSSYDQFMLDLGNKGLLNEIRQALAEEEPA